MGDSGWGFWFSMGLLRVRSWLARVILGAPAVEKKRILRKRLHEFPANAGVPFFLVVLAIGKLEQYLLLSA